MLYASLVGPLVGLYYPVPTDDENIARRMMNSSKLRSLWCSIYTKEQVDACIAKYEGSILPDVFARRLDSYAYILNDED